MPQSWSHRLVSPKKTPTLRLLVALAVLATAVQVTPGSREVVTAEPAGLVAQTRTCAELAASLSQTEQIGQLLMVGIPANGFSTSQGKIVAAAHAGSVIMLGNSTAGVSSVKRLSQRVHGLGGKPSGVKIMLTVDQEGGYVQRLTGPGFDRIPTARDQSKLTNSALSKKAARWGSQLHAAGVDANLAPVADVVPKSLEKVNRPIGILQRGFAANPGVVAGKAPAFIDGMQRAGIATAVKHYPGLGRVIGNTDFERHVVDTITTRHDNALIGFSASSAAGVDMVMVSSATYTKIDKSHRAVFSETVMTDMIRRDTKFTGVVISDDLSARAVSDYSPGKRAVTFLAVGGDLMIVGNSGQVAPMVSAIEAKAKSDARFRAELRVKSTRVLQLKARRGLASCG